MRLVAVKRREHYRQHPEQVPSKLDTPRWGVNEATSPVPGSHQKTSASPQGETLDGAFHDSHRAGRSIPEPGGEPVTVTERNRSSLFRALRPEEHRFPVGTKIPWGILPIHPKAAA